MNDNTDNVTKLPLWKSAVEAAEEEELIVYGQFIPFEWMEKQFHTTRDQPQFRFELMSFNQELQRRGYMVTERGCNQKGLRILNREQMAEAALHKTRQSTDATFRRGACLAVVNRSGLTDEEIQKLDKAEAKVLFTAAVAKAAMRRRVLPDPEMAIKSIKELK